MHNLKCSTELVFPYKMMNILGDKRNLKYFRIHESGDFYSEDYVKKWYEIARALPAVTFYAYTKRNDIFTKELLEEKPSNFKLTWSIDGLHDYLDVNVDSFEKVLKYYDNVAVVTTNANNCINQTDKTKKCMIDCTKCAESGNFIVFKEH